ncbi:hypothetical protein BKA63DRAFT_313201 [Paraphoma chrysanthemicola]|nr:hypothetical protein BKA63DRAFT_313201 [Paraphoma chrysanthemicola]
MWTESKRALWLYRYEPLAMLLYASATMRRQASCNDLMRSDESLISMPQSPRCAKHKWCSSSCIYENSPKSTADEYRCTRRAPPVPNVRRRRWGSPGKTKAPPLHDLKVCFDKTFAACAEQVCPTGRAGTSMSYAGFLWKSRGQRLFRNPRIEHPKFAPWCVPICLSPDFEGFFFCVQ